ncbi:hypothetical protein WH47_11008 [Habropoda laboriosa]|uniref:Uncharacterized protein n=1 Tax=Habropoda laboriosa TaxID=597456 RepID=A0A0L7REF3_9HYME|nr:hypothetical protein WH47_11008 [Habropoda laboriosa]
MQEGETNQPNVNTLQHLLLKPYGFCCDKDQDPKLLVPKQDSIPLFPTSDSTGGGPNIKFRIRDDDEALASAYRGSHRAGYRSGRRSGQRGYLGGQRSRYRGGQQIDWDDESGRRRRQRGEPMICKRCRGPLKWYLEDEVTTAREIMMEKRQDKYNRKMEENVNMAKKMERKRRHRRKKLLSKVKKDMLKEESPKEDSGEGDRKM